MNQTESDGPRSRFERAAGMRCGAFVVVLLLALGLTATA